MSAASGTFTVDLRPDGTELSGTAARFAFTKAFTGDLSGTSTGVMLSAGEPASGTAGYVALEAVQATVEGRTGGFVLQQLGRMADGEQELDYRVVPGSGTGGLTGIDGVLRLTIDDDTHHYTLEFTLADG